MDSYLANIDVYMQERQHQAPTTTSPSFQPQQPPLTSIPQQRYPTPSGPSPPPPPPPQPQLSQQRPQQLPFNDVWLSNIPDLLPTPVYKAYKEPFGQNNVYTNNYSSSNPSASTNLIAPTTTTTTQPIKHKKKPGRKPNPASPALRKAQNRAAQRAFRERKERHLKELETTLRNLREQNRNTKAQLDAYKVESWYLRGVVLTLQFVCMYNQITIPTHSPYMTKEDLIKLMEKSPKDVDTRAMDAYLEACERNDKDIKSVHEFINEKQRVNMSNSNSSIGATTASRHMEDTIKREESNTHEEGSVPHANKSSNSSANDVEAPNRVIDNEEEQQRTATMNYSQENQTAVAGNNTGGQGGQSVKDNIKAIHQIRLQLGVQAALSNSSIADQSTVAARLKPTLIQLSIPHDPRIDLIPTPHTRDRFIIFRDQFAVDQKESNYDDCFNMLLSGAIFHGGDPTLSESWELPEDYFSEYWFLTIDYDDVKGTNKWRRRKGLSDVAPGPRRRATTGGSHITTSATTTAVAAGAAAGAVAVATPINRNDISCQNRMSNYSNTQPVNNTAATTASTFSQQPIWTTTPINDGDVNVDARLSLDELMRDVPALERRQQRDAFYNDITTTLPAPFNNQ